VLLLPSYECEIEKKTRKFIRYKEELGMHSRIRAERVMRIEEKGKKSCCCQTRLQGGPKVAAGHQCAYIEGTRMILREEQVS